MIYAYVKKSQTLAGIPLFGHTEEILVEMGSAALAAAVPYSDKGIRISRQGQYST